MIDETKTSALNRLQALADNMKKAYPVVAEKAQTALAPIEEAIREIDETFRPAHMPELVLTHGTEAKASPACFARDTLTDGSETEYLLCVARGPDSQCHIHVSSCKYDLKSVGEAARERLEAAMQSTALLELNDLPVRLKAKSITALDSFAEAYEEHVLAVRQGLLDGTPTQGPQEASAPVQTLESTAPAEESTIPEPAAFPEPEAQVQAEGEPEPEPESEPEPVVDPMQDEHEEQPEAQAEPEPTPEPEEPEIDADAATEIHDPLVDEIEEHAKELSAATAALDLPAEQWIPTGR